MIVTRFDHSIEAIGCRETEYLSVALGSAHIAYGDNPCCGGNEAFNVVGTLDDVRQLLAALQAGSYPIEFNPEKFEFTCPEFHSASLPAAEFAIDNDRAYTAEEFRRCL